MGRGMSPKAWSLGLGAPNLRGSTIALRNLRIRSMTYCTAMVDTASLLFQ